MKVACVGDSITYGQGISNVAINSYPAVLGRKLGSRYLVRNFGVSGTTAINSGPYPYQAQEAFTQALAFKPDILVVELGTNDSKNTFDTKVKTQFDKDYRGLIIAFIRANRGVKVYTCLPIPSYPQTRKENVTVSTSVLPLVRQATQKTGATVIDLNTPFTNRKDLYRDGFHPTNEGASLLASIVYQSLTPTSTN